MRFSDTVHVISVVTKDRHIPQPTNIDLSLWTLIQSCWNLNPLVRPTAAEIVDTLPRYIESSDESQDHFTWDDQLLTQLNSPWANIKVGVFNLAPALLSDEDIGNIGTNDMIVVLLGPSGVGKSSFVNKIFDDQVASVGDTTVHSCTQYIQAYGRLHRDGSGRKVILVDTPGFDDPERTDYEILEDIVKWLAETYKRDISITGIIILHSIAEPRLEAIPQKNLDVFRKLCGEHSLKRVILTTTFWDKEPFSISEEHESEYLSTYWNGILNHGSQLRRFHPPTHDTAWKLLNAFDTNTHPNALTIQSEIVDQKQNLQQTSAFEALQGFWSKKLRDLRRKFARNNPQSEELARAKKEMKKMTF